ncbi:hypothetical protein KKA09_01450, partial [Patescibacteria group bacterium]|nr:hypothetical protein [Patescibacteria group bacterium]
MVLNNLKNKLKDKKILILGFGKEGKDSYLALRKLFPEKILGIADQNVNCQMSIVKCPYTAEPSGLRQLSNVKCF